MYIYPYFFHSQIDRCITGFIGAIVGDDGREIPSASAGMAVRLRVVAKVCRQSHTCLPVFFLCASYDTVCMHM